MGNETKKSHERRYFNGDFEKYFSGNGIDIGCGSEPVLKSAIGIDKSFGDDALNLQYPDEYFSYVYSSHCLEHIEDINAAIKEWWRVLKPCGHLIVMVPHFTLYEKRKRPSEFNSDHKHYFVPSSLLKHFSFLKNHRLVRLQVNDAGFNFEDKSTDQTIKGAQSEIEIILQKVDDLFWGDFE